MAQVAVDNLMLGVQQLFLAKAEDGAINSAKKAALSEAITKLTASLTDSGTGGDLNLATSAKTLVTSAINDATIALQACNGLFNGSGFLVKTETVGADYFSVDTAYASALEAAAIEPVVESGE